MVKNFLKCELLEVTRSKNGKGVIKYNKLFNSDDFKTKCKFVHYISIQPNSSIGYHDHRQNEEELYIFLKGDGSVCLNEEIIKTEPGDVVVFRDNDKHSIENMSDKNTLDILVVKTLG
jgi:mannose-6-phosphate isomerase-like protein (cupin superfamily)